MATRFAVPPLVRATVAKLRLRVAERFGGRLLDVVLFGSYARGEAHEESDVDVLVLLDRVEWSDRKAILDVAGDLWFETDLFVSPHVIDQATYKRWREEERPLVMDVERDGIRP